MENTTSDISSVHEWNSDLAEDLIPNNVILTLYIIIGITGNMIVVSVYGFRMKKKSDDRYFIPILAISDLAGCTVCGSFSIALNMMQAEFYNTHMCKAWCFFAAFTTYTSVQFLLIIAAQRYLKVCRPLGKQMSLKHKRIAIGVILGLAASLAGPFTALYGAVDFPNTDVSVVGTRCGKLKDVSKSGILAYIVIIATILITCMACMIYFYCRIGHKLFMHFNNTTTLYSNDRRPSCAQRINPRTKSAINTENETCTSDIGNVFGANNGQSYLDIQQVNITAVPKKSTPSAVQNTMKSAPSKRNHREKENRRIMHKFTIMFMIITIVFLICFIPKLILFVIEGLNPNFWQTFSDSERAAVLFFYRLYILNNIMNPFVYAFMDLDFRKETKALLTC